MASVMEYDKHGNEDDFSLNERLYLHFCVEIGTNRSDINGKVFGVGSQLSRNRCSEEISREKLERNEVRFFSRFLNINFK